MATSYNTAAASAAEKKTKQTSTASTGDKQNENDGCMAGIDFATPSSYSDGIFVVEGTKLYIHKQVLSLCSPVFGTMFHGPFVEREKAEIALHDVKLEPFKQFLSCCYPNVETKINGNNVEQLLKLANQFQTTCVTQQCESFLIVSQKADPMVTQGPSGIQWFLTKLIWSEQYNMQQLKEICVDRFVSGSYIHAIKKVPSFKQQLSDSLKVMLFDEMAEPKRSYFPDSEDSD